MRPTRLCRLSAPPSVPDAAVEYWRLMGREQRSRRKLPQGTICYLCGDEILEDEPWDRDHVPPERFYGKSIKRTYNPNLGWLYTHVDCNSAYRSDEEYYVAVFASFAHTDAGRSVVSDLRRGLDKGHGAGLLQTVRDQVGKVLLPDASVDTQNRPLIDS